jgi:hypothetical protein
MHTDGLYYNIILFNILWDSKFVFKTVDLLGAMRGKTQRFANLTLFIATLIGMCASTHMFLMLFRRCFRIIVRSCLPMIGGLGGQDRSSLETFG